MDLEEIVEFIRADRPAAATGVARQIDTAVRSLGRNPLRGPVVPELLDLGVTSYRQIIASPYRVIYRVGENAVYVLAVLDSRRDLQAVLLQRLLR